MNDLIEKHGFVVKVNIVEPDRIKVDFASKHSTEYYVYDDEHTGVVMYKDVDTGLAMDLPRPILRLYILCDIYRLCRALDLPYTIVNFYDTDGKSVNFQEYFTISLDENETAQEKLLQKYVQTCFFGKPEKIALAEKKLDQSGILHWALLLRGLII